MNVRRTRAWKAAEWQYTDIYTQCMVPLFGAQLSPDEIIERLEKITKDCPEFYPALLELGLRRLATGNSRGERQIEKGFHLMLELAQPEHLNEELDNLIGNLEQLWRFDLSRRYVELLVQRYPDNAQFQDDLAHALLRLGDVEAALVYASRAVEMQPDNPHFRSNLGWKHLAAGNLEKARENLAEALRLSPDDGVVKGNLEIHQYLAEHGGNYFDYLIRPADKEELDRLGNEEDWEQVDKLCASYNDCRVEALAQSLLQEDEQKRARLPDLLSTLRQFFGFVHKLDAGGYVLNEDIGFIHEHFKPIMHKFIFKFNDIDRELIEGIYESLFEYYGFLAGRGLVSAREFKRFQKKILGMKGELIDKMERYNAIRHDDTMDDGQKEDIRDELFEGDHFWPFL